jgi:hypothetical protein
MSVIILTVDVKETRPASRLRDHHGPASEGIRYFTRERQGHQTQRHDNTRRAPGHRTCAPLAAQQPRGHGSDRAANGSAPSGRDEADTPVRYALTATASAREAKWQRR